MRYRDLKAQLPFLKRNKVELNKLIKLAGKGEKQIRVVAIDGVEVTMQILPPIPKPQFVFEWNPGERLDSFATVFNNWSKSILH